MKTNIESKQIAHGMISKNLLNLFKSSLKLSKSVKGPSKAMSYNTSLPYRGMAEDKLRKT